MARIFILPALIVLTATQFIFGATITGELKKWHKVTLLFDGVNTDESAATNPFTEYRLIVTFTNGANTKVVYGHYAADGNAAETGATSGDKWRVYFTPDATGTWNYSVSFRTGTDINLSDNISSGTAVSPLNGETGSFTIAASDKTGDDFRAKGRLGYANAHYLQFAETGDYFIKGGSDSPENFLAYWEFDGTYDTGGPQDDSLINGLHRYATHATNDWHSGDPVWQTSKGKGIIGALNYLASKEVNSVYFLSYNVDGGDGRDVWVWTSDTERERFDVSKLDQWEIVFAHMDSLGIQMHFVLQEEENDNVLGGSSSLNDVRKLYFKELTSRFAHHLAILWNLGEENGNTNAQRASFAQYIREHDPYENPITVHTLNNPSTLWETFYDGILNDTSYLKYFEVTSLQGNGSLYNSGASSLRTLSASKGKKWIICGDEQTPDATSSWQNSNRKDALWGNLMGGGGGVEWYTGYNGWIHDLQLEDFSMMSYYWDVTRYALDFFHTYLPFDEMSADNSLFSATNGATGYCFAKPGETYAVYIKPNATNNITVSLNISGTDSYTIKWYNPRTGGALQDGTVTSVTASNSIVSIGRNPLNDNNDWVALVTNNSLVTLAPEINVKQSAVSISSGGTHSFPSTIVSASSDVVFTIENTGTGTLTLTTPLTASGDYSIISQPASPVAASGTTTFTVRFTPTASGTRTGSVTIVNDDSNEGNYVINFTGTGITTTTWTGNVSDDWFNSSNWTFGVPTDIIDAVIPDVSPKSFPVIQGLAGTVAETDDLTIHANASVTVSNLNNVQLMVHGIFTSSGQVLGTGRLAFNGGITHTMSSPLSFSGVLEVKSGSMLVTNGNLTLEDGASLLHGTGTPNGGGAVSGAVKMRRNGNANSNAYSYWSAPVASANVSVLGNNLYYYNPNNATDNSTAGLRNGWVAAGGSMTAGLGYIGRGNALVEFNGSANDGNYNIGVSKNATTGVGWNLIGNPYPCALNASSFMAVNGPAGSNVISGALYFWDDDQTNGSGWATQDYAVWTGAGTVAGPNTGTLFQGHIGSGQGFFVLKNADGTSNVQFTNSMRSSTNNAFFREMPIQRLWLSAVSSNGFYNETLVAFISDATDSIDAVYDAKKLKGNDYISLYTKIQNEAYAIQALSLLDNDRSVVVGIDAGVSGTFTLRLKTIENLDETVCLYLADTQTGEIQDLRLEPIYTFTTQAGIFDSRFILHFTAPFKVETNKATCNGNDGEIKLMQAGSKEWNYILSTSPNGYTVERQANFNGEHLIDNLPPGSYTLTLRDDNGYEVLKSVEISGVEVVENDFTMNSSVVNQNEPIYFTNLSSGATNYEWTFDYTYTSNEVNPVFAFGTPGNHTVILRAANDDCSAVRKKVITILKAEEATGIIEAGEPSVKIYSRQSSLHVEFHGISGSAAIEVFNLLGETMFTGNFSVTSAAIIQLPHARTGFYLVKVVAQERIFTRKIDLNIR